MTKRILSIFLICFFASSLFSQSRDDLKLAKKNERIERRYIHPKSKYISVSVGWNFASTFSKDPNNFLEQGMVMGNSGFFPSVIYEHGIKNNFFGELGYDYTQLGYRFSRDAGDGISWSIYARNPGQNHNSHNIKIGGGYRVIGKKNHHFLNLHGGLFFGFSNLNKQSIASFYENPDLWQISEPNNDLNYLISRNFNSYSRFTFGSYIGVSKEFRLSEDIRFFVKYIQRFGFGSNFSGTYSFSENLGFDKDATFNVRGGGAFISGGLKVLLFKKQLIKND